MDENTAGTVSAVGYEVAWTDALHEQFGSVPWWFVSTGLHVVVLLLMTLVTVSTPPPAVSEIIIPLDMTRPVEAPEVEKTPRTRDMFSNPKDVESTTIVKDPVLTTEPVEVDTHLETENNVENNTARGELENVSDVPCGGRGVVPTIGLGGGGAGCFGVRDGGGKGRAVLRNGGNKVSEERVKAALRWLARNQERDGHWAVQKWEGQRDEEACVGVTGLGLLAFLGAGHTERGGEHRDVVRRAVSYLVSRQDARGMIGRNESYEHGGGYNHAIAGLALAEAAGMGRIPETMAAAQKAVNFSVKGFQREYSGWRYRPGGDDCDTSVSGWFIMQLKSATIAGLTVDQRAYQGAIAWLDKVTEAGAGGSYGGRASYQPGREYSTTMTAVAMLGRQFMGWKSSDPVLVGGANHLVENTPKWNAGPGYMYYYWYYGTLCMYQMGGEYWKTWNGAMRDMISSNQVDDPTNTRLDGSWDPIQDGQQGGRAYSTAICCMCLEVYYRYGNLTK